MARAVLQCLFKKHSSPLHYKSRNSSVPFKEKKNRNNHRAQLLFNGYCYFSEIR